MFLKFGSRKVVVVSSPEAVEECFTTNDIIFANRPKLLMGTAFTYETSVPIGIASYGDHWKNAKRLLNTELLCTNRLSGLKHIRTEEVKCLLENIFENSNGNKVELKSLFVDLFFNIITRMIAGKRYYGTDAISEEAKGFRKMIGEVVEIMGTSYLEDNFPFLERLDIHGLKKKMQMQMKKMDEFLQMIVADRRNQYTNGKQNVLIDVMFSLEHTDESIKSMMQTLILAGTETPATTLEWGMALLLNHPESMKKLIQEIEARVGNNRLLDENDLPNLPYLHNVLKETLRLCSPVPLLVPHESSKDCKVCGFDIPKGTMLLVNAWAIQRNPKYWKDAEEFKPERFDVIHENEEYNLFPFGLGRRACPGTNLGRKVLALALGSMVQCFDWKRGGEEKIDMSEITGLTTRKKVPLEAICEPRQLAKDYFSAQVARN